MGDLVWCTRSFFEDFSLIYEDLSNIHTIKIAYYMVTEHCPRLYVYRPLFYGYMVTEQRPSNHLMPIIAL